MNINNFGRKSAEEIMEKLAKYDLYLKKDSDEKQNESEK